MFTPLFKPVRAKTKVYLYLNYPKLPLASPGILRLRKGFKDGGIVKAVADLGEGPGGPPSPLLLGQTEARRAEKKNLDAAPPPPLCKGLDNPPSPGFANN